MNTNKKETYICWVHTEVRQDKPGTCSRCALYLVPEFVEQELGTISSRSASVATKKKN